MPPEALTDLTHAVYTSSCGTFDAPKGPEQEQMNPTLIGAPAAWGVDDALDGALDDDEELADEVGVEVDLWLDEEQAAATRATVSTTIDLKSLGLATSSPL
jgi:hypothetical protein